ncbi:transposase [Micromonospora sp. U56]|nr:transposase [Micromonospora sp. U56]
MRRGEQPPWIVSDDLWAEIPPLLPPRPARRRRCPGRKPLDDRKVLCGILFVLYTAIPWEYLPQELGFGSGMTCWRRLRDWNDAGVWQRLHEVLLGRLRAVIDGSHIRAVKGGPKPKGARQVPRQCPSNSDLRRAGTVGSRCFTSGCGAGCTKAIATCVRTLPRASCCAEPATPTQSLVTTAGPGPQTATGRRSAIYGRTRRGGRGVSVLTVCATSGRRRCRCEARRARPGCQGWVSPVVQSK